MATKMVMIRAVRIHNYNNGLVGIEVEAGELTEKASELLHDLFPNLRDRAEQLLDQESLLASLHTGPFPVSPRHDTIECAGAESKKNR